MTFCCLLEEGNGGREDRKNIEFCFGFPGGTDGKESACNAGDMGLITGLGRSHGEGNDCALSIFA